MQSRQPDQLQAPGLSRLTLFALLFAWANILHQLSYPEWVKAPHLIGWLLFFSSASLALWPSSIKLFLSTLILRVAFTLDWMPMIREHLFLEGLFSVGILIALFHRPRDLRRDRWSDPDKQEELFESFAPFLRVTTLIVYAAVTICKLNSEFLDPRESESANLLIWTAQSFPFIPTANWAREASIWATLLFEGGIPILLLFRKTRWLGVLVGIIFHSMLGFLPLKIWSFTSTMILLLFTWLPPRSASAIGSTFHRWCQATKLSPFAIAIAFYAVAGTSGLAYAARNGLNWDMQTVDLGMVIWWWQSLAILAALWAVHGLTPQRTATLFQLRLPALRLYTLVIILNCLCPYIGLKNRLALNMQSNLRTADGYWNHLFLPESMRVFTFQDRLVTITSSDSPDFDAVSKQGMPMPVFEFRRWCRGIASDFYVDYLDPEGIPRRFTKSGGHGSDPELMVPHPLLEKILCFNPIGANYDYLPEEIPHVGPSRNRVPRFDTE